jgi:hypothetical protein
MEVRAMIATRTRMTVHRTTVLVTALTLSACSGGGSSSSSVPATASPTTAPTSTPTQTLSGNFAGSATDSIAGSGYVSFQINQSGSQASGYWGSAYPSWGFVNGGTLSGSISGTTLTAIATSQVTNGCSVNVTGTLASGTITGRYTGIGTGCTSDTGTFTAPTITVPTLGNYAGTIADSVAGNGALSFTLTQNTVFLQGSWSDSFSNASYSNSGTAYGAVIGNNKVAFGAIPTSPTACRFVVVGTLSGTTIAGAYAAPTTGAYACSTPDTGTFSVTEH